MKETAEWPEEFDEAFEKFNDGFKSMEKGFKKVKPSKVIKIHKVTNGVPDKHKFILLIMAVITIISLAFAAGMAHYLGS